MHIYLYPDLNGDGTGKVKELLFMVLGILVFSQMEAGINLLDIPHDNEELFSTTDLLESMPNGLGPEFQKHAIHNSARTIMNITYSIEVSDEDDRYITMAEKALDGMAKAAHPDAFLIEIFPFIHLKHIPEFMSFTGFKRKVREWREAVLEMCDVPYKAVENALASFVTIVPCH
ncbi:hypothetical protein EDD85DRAFT_791188 [Armillaria nabsnona]|nr:hypothetical protein EDD85DRAFT_791188 [Armillaria nabsnona]